MSWYLRSTGDQDTHHGELHEGAVVAARCGAVFRPLSLPFNRIALPGYPQDRDQIGAACKRAKVVR